MKNHTCAICCRLVNDRGWCSTLSIVHRQMHRARPRPLDQPEKAVLGTTVTAGDINFKAGLLFLNSVISKTAVITPPNSLFQVQSGLAGAVLSQKLIWAA